MADIPSAAVSHSDSRTAAHTCGREYPASATYLHRHLGPDATEQHAMLEALGYDNIDDVIAAVVPADIRDTTITEGSAPARALSEEDALARLRTLAAKNTVLKSFYGQGYYDTVTPPVIRRNVVENPGWYTAYTPYQPEISQGRLEALLNFQTMVSELTGLPVANASLLDEASAVAEAVGLMARAKRKGRTVVLDQALHPQVISTARERAHTLGLTVEIHPLDEPLVGDDYVGIVLAYPGTEGQVIDPTQTIQDMKDRGGLVAIACDLLALQLLESPGTLGADIAVGSSQRFGVPLFFGGPHAAFMAVADKYKRQLPGRLVGVSKDADGFPAYRLALQTREQHIRRERATSNICTAQALLAVVASMYAVYHGPEGLRAIATRVHRLAEEFAAQLGSAVVYPHFFDTVTVSTPGQAAQIAENLADAGYLVRCIGQDRISVSFGESATEGDVKVLVDAIVGSAGTSISETENRDAIPEQLQRSTDTLTHPIFSSIHSETQMLRYLRRLCDRDLALDRTMIPLGSCTMKLNPTAGMEPITWPEFAGIHPFAPAKYTQGWRELIRELEDWLAKVTGYAKVSVQPNAGSQGELAGLLAIRRYHLSRGDEKRDICLIPQSAHGTNAASAALANLKVVIVATADDGSVDLDDLDAKLDKHGEHVAAIMITYPSTHGVFEETVREVCSKVHNAGGQVYIDGANMNALAGIARPGNFGGDVSHLNLHKTFTIPHGGGGPGVGPVCVAEHLVPFIPTEITAAPFGSAGVLPISWAYLAMSGADGLPSITGHAILAANYIAHQLRDSFPVLYTGRDGAVAHECILDLRELTDASKVTALDVCKRLVDFGFHAPTLAFPVAGTLMVEPTESEDLAELDRFITAMRTIRAEIQEIIDGAIAYEDSVIRHAPYTAEAVGANEWDYQFSRQQAAWPVPELYRHKYFPPVRRIDDAYGDRNLVCACPPPEAFDISGASDE